jgi:hypothetical protein
MNTKIVIRRFGVLSMAKLYGALCALLGLIIGAFISLFAVLGAAFLPSNSGLSGGASILFGVGAIILLPILYGVFGFLTGLITAALYNLLARMMGGLEIEGVQTSI